MLRAFLAVVAVAGLLHSEAAASDAVRHVPAAERSFLEDLEHRGVLYFWEQADPNTGLVLDRAGADGGRARGPSRDVASIAATGFGLSALCIGAEHGWIPRRSALERARTTLRFLATQASQEHGWFYHWMDLATGERRWDSEASSVDTAFLVAGALTAGQYFSEDEELGNLARQIYDRVDFPWMLNGDPVLLSHGWKPDKGFLAYRWSTYSEASILYLLGIGSRTHPLPTASWYAWDRPLYVYGPFQFISGGPLFTHQFSHAWVDFRNRRDRGFIDFFANSVAATRANRLFCLNLQAMFPLSFGPDIWGVTASDGVKGYRIYSEIAHFESIDGTVAPCAAGGSLMFTPDISISALLAIRERYRDRVYGRYGFVDAFNPGAQWFDSDVIGIDTGITLLSAENLLTGNVWRWFMANEAVPRAMNLLDFSPAPQVPEDVKEPAAPAVKRKPARRTKTRRVEKHSTRAAAPTTP